jgi:pimeloyl-ACP methyl ester carboxylesterase
MSAVQITDHQGNKVSHSRVLVNGVRLHYITAGAGAPLLLLHGVPKTSFYWYRIIPFVAHQRPAACAAFSKSTGRISKMPNRPFNGRRTNLRYRSLLLVASTS